MPSAECRVPVALLALLIAVAPLSAQSVAAAGQLPAVPGRFGFSLECVQGCTWVEPGIDHSYFRHHGEPRVSAVPKNGPAWRAGLRVGDLIVDVDSVPVTSIHAGLLLASDTVERLVLTLKDARGTARMVAMWSAGRCDGVRAVVVANHSGDDVNVYMTTRRRTRLFRRVGPGETEFAIPGTDSMYRADGAYFYGRPTSDRQNRNAWEQQVFFRVLCRRG